MLEGPSRMIADRKLRHVRPYRGALQRNEEELIGIDISSLIGPLESMALFDGLARIILIGITSTIRGHTAMQ